ncbi:MAG: xanthine dehydrogenase family protein subunit M [Deltaproteobacteria bacterium]|nr:xanthine dehydrogenase family protein subunit M [Deltaproteobacteria bacterium]
MATPLFEHYQPRSLEEALDLLGMYRSSVKLFAGGTDLVPKIRAGVVKARHIVSLNRVPGLAGISFMEDDGLVIGATTKISAVADHPAVQERYPALAHACSVMATPQIRNMGTVTGNLVNAAPSADTALPLLVYGANLVLVERGGRRRERLEEFFTGPGCCSLEPVEMVEAIRVPSPPERSGSCHMRLSARSQVDIAAVGVAGMLCLDMAGRIITARIALGSVAPTPLRAREAEDMLVGQMPEPKLLARAAAGCVRVSRPIDDVRATAAYRRAMVHVLAQRVLERCLVLAQGGER